MKRLILVTSPPASGKTFVSKKLAENLDHVVYLDKDTLIPLSKQIFKIGGEEYNRSSDFFQENIRDYEYITILDLAMEALDYEDLVLINAPFTEEVRDYAYMKDLQDRLSKKNARLCIIWVSAPPEVCRQRMIARNSDRDTWKIANWDEYIKGYNFDPPLELKRDGDHLDILIFENADTEQYEASMQKTLAFLQNK